MLAKIDRTWIGGVLVLLSLHVGCSRHTTDSALPGDKIPSATDGPAIVSGTLELLGETIPLNQQQLAEAIALYEEIRTSTTAKPAILDTATAPESTLRLASSEKPAARWFSHYSSLRYVDLTGGNLLEVTERDNMQIVEFFQRVKASHEGAAHAN